LPQSFEDVQKQCEEVLRLERRYIYTTPKSFLELIKLFKGMLAQKKGELEG
jgi:dynein heavy chain